MFKHFLVKPFLLKCSMLGPIFIVRKLETMFRNCHSYRIIFWEQSSPVPLSYNSLVGHVSSATNPELGLVGAEWSWVMCKFGWGFEMLM